MKKLFVLIGLTALLPLSACFGPIKVNVYGASGKAYTAPALCAALIACQNSNETACYYDRTLYRDLDGKTLDESGCKEIKK